MFSNCYSCKLIKIFKNIELKFSEVQPGMPQNIPAKSCNSKNVSPLSQLWDTHTALNTRTAFNSQTYVINVKKKIHYDKKI